MSEYVVCETHVCDLECLKKALVDIGIPEEAITVFDSPQKIVLGSNEKTMSRDANIVINGSMIGTHYDIGFAKKADGKYESLIGSTSRSNTVERMRSTTVGGTGEMAQHYAKHMALREQQKRYGHRIKSCTQKDGKIRIRIAL